MTHNVGSYDAAARTVLGIAGVMVGHHYETWWALAGFVPVLTAIVAFCPAYALLGINTCSQDETDPPHGAHSNK